jgi:hypothetical protein
LARKERFEKKEEARVEDVGFYMLPTHLGLGPSGMAWLH